MSVLIELVLLAIVLGVVFWIITLVAKGLTSVPPWIIQAVGGVFLLIFLLACFRALGLVPYGWRP